MEPFYMPEGALPPGEVRISGIKVEPWPDGRRVKVAISLTPFQKPPNLRADILLPDGESIASAHIIETIQHRMVFTMHIRGHEEIHQFALSVVLQYPDLGDVHQQQVEFSLPAPADGQ